MGSSGLDLSLDASPVQRSKEENQERAFVAASRRKDRSLDARLESANRASMLHKKRTGKALHITKDIVEREAMYEEIDERYQEKRLSILKAHTTELEAQFHRHLMATMAMNKTARQQQQQQQQQQQTRISHHGGIQKMRNLSLGSNEGFFRPETHLKLQNGGSPISPTASSSTVPSPTSPVFEVYGGGSSSFSSATSSNVSYFVQTPATGCYDPVPMACPQYVDTGLMSPSVSPRNSIYQQNINSVQPTHLRSASIALAQSSRSNAPLFSRRLASYPDVSFMIPSASMGGVSGQAAAAAATNFNFQAISNPSSQPSTTPSPTSCVPTASTPGMTNMQENGLLPSPALSTSSMSPDSSHNATQYSEQIAPPEVQVEFDEVDPFKQQPILGSPENPDPDYNEFLDFASSMEDPWQLPVGNNNTSFDDLVNLDNLDYEFSHTAMYR